MLSDDAPMNQAVWHWRMINDLEFRDRWMAFGAMCEEWKMESARDLLEACESLNHHEIYEFVKLHPPTGDVISELVQMAKQAQKTKAAKESAKKRHIENRAMKAEAFQWLDSNMVQFESMDSAAAAITKQQPIAFRTARAWTSEWKKLRSASTP